MLKTRFGTPSRALIADSQATARGVLASQPRALGIDRITPGSRAGAVRKCRATHPHDVFVCVHAPSDGTLGQDLSDE